MSGNITLGLRDCHASFTEPRSNMSMSGAWSGDGRGLFVSEIRSAARWEPR